MRSLPIVWQRLVSPEGRTCVRCDATHQGLQEAIAKLEEILRPAGIQLTLSIKEIDSDTFNADPSQSNRIWIAGKPIEEWISARVASSPCCSVCGDSECRTLEIENQTFEAVPSELILKAALAAASQQFGLGD